MSRATSVLSPAGVVSLGRRVLTGVLDLVYPPVCRLCDRELTPVGHCICEPCREKLVQDPHETCPRCAETVGPFTANEAGCVRCANQDLRFDGAIRLGPYEGVLRSTILQIKHARAADLADELGGVMGQQLQWHSLAPTVDVIVPVPLHWLRRLQRGYNQAEALGRSLARVLGKPIQKRWLSRRRYTAQQSGQSMTARRENMRGAFCAAARQALRGKTVLLVDDVMTTGSTCSEAARALKHAGAGRVLVAVLARSVAK